MMGVSGRFIAGSIATSLIVAMLPVPTVSAAALQPVVHQVILGDSYSAGNGAGSYAGPNACYRSPNDWGQLLATKLRARGFVVDTQNFACNGAIAWDVDHEEKLQDESGTNQDPIDQNTSARLRKRPNADDSCPSADISKPEEVGFAPGHFWRRGFPFHSECKYFLEPQVDHLSRTTNLVTMTIGGNDLGFDKIVGRCLIMGLADSEIVGGLAGMPLSCKSYVDTALARLHDPGSNGLKARLLRVLGAVGSRIDPAGVVEYLGYPSLVGDVSIPQSDYPQAATAIRAGAVELENLQRQVVNELNAAAGSHPTYVFVPVLADFFGHEVLKVGSSIASPNSDRWFVAPVRDGSTTSLWYHPNPTGQAEEARLADAGLLTVPSRPASLDRRALDMVFVIDTTGSMGPYIDGVKLSAINTVNALDSVSTSWRVAVVSYRDFPSRTGADFDYPSQVILDFSSDKTTVINAINSLGLGFGGDEPETMYSGIMAGVGLQWRASVDKRMLVMSDAAALDPEPFTGLTAASVAAAAIAVDPVQFVGLAVGFSPGPVDSLQSLVDLTGGVVETSGFGDAGAAMVTAIQNLSTDPVALLSGPYVATPGQTLTLDASGSFDPVGSIVSYSWDLDGDGVFDATTTSPTLAVTSASPASATISVKVTSSTGRSSTATSSVVVTSRPDSGLGQQSPFYEPITPVRVLDTRIGLGVPAASRLVGGQALELSLVGRSELTLPDDASAVALNVTVDHATGPGFLTVWPCGTPRPLASNLNYVAGGTVPNLVLSGLGDGGKVCIFSQVDVDVIADVNGFGPALTGVYPIVPVRVLDSRTGVGTTLHRLAPGETVSLQLAGQPDSQVPANAAAAILNVTVDRATGPGFITVWPCGQPRPLASNLNYVAGSTVPNLVVADIGLAGSTCLFSSNGVDLLADLDGFIDASAPYSAHAPVRLLDTRVGVAAPTSPLAAGATLELTIPTEELPDPVGGSAVLNVTVDKAADAGFVTVWPCGTPRPLASNLNYFRGSTIPNLVISGIGVGHKVCFFSSASVDLIADFDGAFVANEPLTGHLVLA